MFLLTLIIISKEILYDVLRFPNGEAATQFRFSKTVSDILEIKGALAASQENQIKIRGFYFDTHMIPPEVISLTQGNNSFGNV